MSGPPLYAWSVEHTRTHALKEFLPNFPTTVASHDSRKAHCLQNQVSSQKKKVTKRVLAKLGEAVGFACRKKRRSSLIV